MKITNNFNVDINEPYYSIKRLQECGLGYQYYEDNEYNGKTIRINNADILNFANCSYLALEKHPALIQGAIEAVKHYGTQSSMSRALLSSPLYKELETCLSKAFPGHLNIYASTTLVHYSALPLLVKKNDALILDAYAHNSIRVASQLCKDNGAFILLAKHNDMEHVKYLIKRLKKEGYKNIWYCADGIYSMHGDLCDIKGLQKLLDEEDNFYAYVDDAHGMGWCGKNGSGYVIGNYGLHDKMIVAGSLSKSIAVSGGILVIPDKLLADYLKLTGSTFIFTIPLPPASLGALIASIKLHLSNELTEYQNELIELILYFKKRCKELFLSVASEDVTPIQLIMIGDLEKVIKIQKRLLEKGYFSTTAVYPSISEREQGIRISISRHMKKTDIDHFLMDIKQVLEIENIGVEKKN